MPRPRRDIIRDRGATSDQLDVRLCDHPGCAEAGDFRAPRAREPGSGTYWFCLGHVRLYNAAWDFFHGMSQAEIEAYQHDNATWHRPTWRLGTSRSEPSEHAVWVDPYDFINETGLGGFRQGATEPPPPRVAPEERQALAALELEPVVTLQDIKTRYKQLVKRFHPDANGGDKTAEERLKRINQAYTFLLSCGYT